jgi:hypothetical protein
MRRRSWMGWSFTAVLLMTQACYEYVSVETLEAPVGKVVELRITDPGRVGLAPRFGPGLDRVNGRLLSAPDTALTVGVLSVTNLDGVRTSWAGEEVRLNRGFIRSVRSRQFSPTRTSIIAGAAAVVLYFTAVRPLTGGGKDPRDPPDPIDPPVSNRSPMGLRLRLIR